MFLQIFPYRPGLPLEYRYEGCPAISRARFWSKPGRASEKTAAVDWSGGGPAKATETLIYKVWTDGVINLDLGSSSAQSVILLIIVIALTALQFRYVERKVHY